MVNKLKIYILTNFFSNKSTLFIPKSDSDIHEDIIQKLSQRKISSGDLKILNEKYDGLNDLPKEYIVQRTNIHTLNYNDLRNLIYSLFGIKPDNQLLFYETKKTNDYENRILTDLKKPSPTKTDEVYGFYYKNNLGKRLLNCNLNNNILYKGQNDKSDLFYVDNSILYSKSIENNTIYLVDYDNYEEKHGSNDNFSYIKKLMFPYLKQAQPTDFELEEENKRLMTKIVEENNTLQNTLDSASINKNFFNSGAQNRINNLVIYSNGYEKTNLNLKDIFDSFKCSIDTPYIRYRNFIKNNLFKVYKYGLDISLFDRESLKQRVIEINEKIKLLNEQKQLQKVLFYKTELKQTLDAIASLKKQRN